MKVAFRLSILIALLTGCKEDYPFPTSSGVKPIYITRAELSDIRNLPPQPTEKTGPILLYGNLFFMVEQKRGIHVFDVTNLSNPFKISFIKIPAINDFSVTNNLLLADNGPNLVSLDISDIHNVVVLSVQENVFQEILYPINYSGFFECGDPSQGIIIDWVPTLVSEARCRIIN